MQGKNKVIYRVVEKRIDEALRRGRSVLIFGSRQTGKTTVSKRLLSQCKNTLEYPLQNPTLRISLETDPGKIIREIQAQNETELPLVFIDEAQKVPDIFDAAQYLIDEKQARFLITGSSDRKLRRRGANLLPGRVERFFLDPLLLAELGMVKGNTVPELATENIAANSASYTLSDLLVYGSLPRVTDEPASSREALLTAYSEIYLEEEIRAEALSRNIGAFSRFLELAAHESGTSPNYTKLSNESGVSAPTIKTFYQIMEDTLVIERVEPFLRNARKRILASPRYYFFDVGVRNTLARLPSGSGLAGAERGIAFEHLVVLEIRRRIRALGKQYHTYYWRTSGGAEVDCVIDMGDKVIPIEIKSGKSIGLLELKGLRNFLEEHRDIAPVGYVVMPDGNKEKLADNIFRIPFAEL